MHICQLSRIIQESPGYSTHLPLSHTGHQISQIGLNRLVSISVLYFGLKPTFFFWGIFASI